MSLIYKHSLFIFRRDLRLTDNTALNEALKQSHSVIPCFIFDPTQVTHKNKYYSANAVQFMIESLQDLDKQLRAKKGKLYLFYGDTEHVLKTIIKTISVDALFCNKDYTPFSNARDKAIEQLCIKNDIAFNTFDDALLNAPTAVAKVDGSFYSMFTPFYNAAKKIPVQKPHTHHGTFYSPTDLYNKPTVLYDKVLSSFNDELYVHGGATLAHTILTHLKDLTAYETERDFPIVETSALSAHLKFGTVSAREAYYAIKEKLGIHHLLLKQLYWRDFFTHIAFHRPDVFGHPFHKKYEKLPWKNDEKEFKAWCAGKTGFPIVDAGMRQLNATGFMHNRVRMIVASFLIKDLHIDWRKGEHYFAQQLVDYDPAVNNGNWQWCASTGCDSQPYFRIFNPWLQQKKFDPDCVYIKTWIPELQDYDPKILHNWFKENSPHIEGYEKPIIDHARESAISKKIYSSA